MTSDEFNKKWKNHLEDGHYGVAIENEVVLKYLDEEFTKELENNPSFNYSQIKLKFGMARVYSNSDKNAVWEKEINRMVTY